MRALSSRWRQTQKKGKPTAGLDQTVLPFSSPPRATHVFAIEKAGQHKPPHTPDKVPRKTDDKSFHVGQQGEKRRDISCFPFVGETTHKTSISPSKQVMACFQEGKQFHDESNSHLFQQPGQQPMAENTPSMTPPTTPRLFTTYEQVQGGRKVRMATQVFFWLSLIIPKGGRDLRHFLSTRIFKKRKEEKIRNHRKYLDVDRRRFLASSSKLI